MTNEETADRLRDIIRQARLILEDLEAQKCSRCGGTGLQPDCLFCFCPAGIDRFREAGRHRLERGPHQ